MSITTTTEYQRRSPMKYRSKVSSFSSIAVDDVVDLTDVELRDPVPTLERSSSLAHEESDILVQPIPSIPRVGPHNFEKLRVLGVGSTGRVYLVRSVGLGPEEYFAMKVVKKSELVRRNRVQRVLTERQILSVANHPFVVTLHYCFQTADFFYLVMQYCAGGELFSFLRRQEDHRLCEAHAKFYAAEVLLALEYLHLIGIIYRDLKPENILVHESGHVMLSDFDLAHEVKPTVQSPSINDRTYSTLLDKKQPFVALSPTISTTDPMVWSRMRKRRPTVFHVVDVANPPTKTIVSKRRFSCPCVSIPRDAYPHLDTESHINLGEKRTSFVGTHEYVAPEIIAEEGYVGSVDWWAFGILLYEMIVGVTPFKGQTQIQTLENIFDICGEIEFPPDVPISPECKDLLERLLTKDMTKRLQNPLLIKSHPFFQGLVWSLIRHQPPPIIPTMVHSLQEKHFTEADLCEFDDEVPFHRALGSPKRRSRPYSLSSASSTGDTAHLPSFAQLSEDGQSQSEVSFAGESDSGHSKAREESIQARIRNPSREHPPVRTAAVPVALDEVWVPPLGLSNSPEKLSPVRSRHNSKTRSPKRTDSTCCLAVTPEEAMIAANTMDGIVHDFEFISNQRNSYWSSTDSQRSLSVKLLQLDLAAMALGPEGNDDHNLEEEKDTNCDDGDLESSSFDYRASVEAALVVE